MGFSKVVAGFWSVPWRDLAGQPPSPPRLESKRRFRGLAAKPSPLSAPAQRELRRALTASADSRASCQLSNSHEKAGPFNSQQFATPCSLKIMERPGTQPPPVLKDIGGLLILALLQQVPRCQNPFPAIDTSARVLPLPEPGDNARQPAKPPMSIRFAARLPSRGHRTLLVSAAGLPVWPWNVEAFAAAAHPTGRSGSTRLMCARPFSDATCTMWDGRPVRMAEDAGREELPILELVPCTAMHAVTSGPR